MTIRAGGLFAGIGGFCEGFDHAGIERSWAVDIDERVRDSYVLNRGSERFRLEDIRTIGTKNGADLALDPVDVLHAGFPCQSFSMAGERKGFDDERGRLFFELIRIVQGFGDDKPAVLVFENSPYLMVGDRGGWFRVVKTEIQRAGYWFKESNAFVLDPQEHLGLPHYRPRLFMIALSRAHFRSARFELSLPKPRPRLLGEFVNFCGEQDDAYYLHEENRYFGMIAAKRIKQPETLYQLRKFRVRVKDHCPTLTANMGMGGHNVPFLFDRKGLRKLTEVECLRLQGFEGFRFPEALPGSVKYQQVGNSVHVEIAKILACAVRRKLEG